LHQPLIHLEESPILVAAHSCSQTWCC